MSSPTRATLFHIALSRSKFQRIRGLYCTLKLHSFPGTSSCPESITHHNSLTSPQNSHGFLCLLSHSQIAFQFHEQFKSFSPFRQEMFELIHTVLMKL